MDANTKKVLGKINAKTAQMVAKKGLTKVEVDTEGEEFVQRRMRDADISPRLRKKLEHHIEKGDFRHEEEVLDEAHIKEVDDFQRKEVAAAIARGEIADPNDDPFVKSRQQRMKKRSWAVVGEGIVRPGINRVLVEPLDDPFNESPTAKFGIIVPDSSKPQKKTLYGRIHALGPHRSKDGTPLEWEVEVGDVVVYADYGWDGLTMGKKVMHVVEEPSLLMKIQL